MATRNIRLDTDPILRKKSRPVEVFDEKLWKLLDDLRDTLGKAEGVGLAAPQVGVLRRAVIVDVGDGLLELVNPEIVFSEGCQHETEGCLSVPDRAGVTERPERVRVRAQNRDGNWCLYEGTGLKAQCFCHEIDHLDGILFVDRLAPGEKLFRPEAKDKRRKK
ncbi:MAG: peptide deformylase [Clostridia bacterium]|nr:peptide deformylase [Clostridia bacterium]